MGLARVFRGSKEGFLQEGFLNEPGKGFFKGF